MTRLLTHALTLALTLGISTSALADDSEWKELFNGKNLDGWKASENTETFSVKDGVIVVDGNRSHLFYVGDVNGGKFKNFELKAVVMTKPKANSGIYFHSKFQDKGWPDNGFEVQVNNTHGDPKKTGSLYGVVNVLEAPADDNKWFTVHITVKGDTVTTKVDDKSLVKWSQPDDFKDKKFPGRKLSEGTFALQGHDPKSVVHYKSIKVKVLPDEEK